MMSITRRRNLTQTLSDVHHPDAEHREAEGSHTNLTRSLFVQYDGKPGTIPLLLK